MKTHTEARTRGERAISVTPVAMRAAIATVLGGVLSATVMASDLPTGHVTNGRATVTESGNSMTVQQSSGKVAIDWTSFSIGAGDSVTFRQPSSSAIALNEILEQKPSSIFGSLSANGQVASKVGTGDGGRQRDHDRPRCALDADVANTGATSRVHTRDAHRAP
jgi:large exoprotein involved in heme utilization and adhesion